MLTGRMRYRIQRRLFGREKLVLQVEIRQMDLISLGGNVLSRHDWRDAEYHDLEKIKTRQEAITLPVLSVSPVKKQEMAHA